jgi:hypothetical protein
MGKVSIFIPIRKVDEEQRLVYGVASREELDKTNEIFDYEASKPYIKAWSDSFANTTKAAGQDISYGNLRAMHRPVSAGKLNEPVAFHDQDKAVSVCAKVVDDGEWQKVLNGVYTGFSFGGKTVGAKTPDPNLGGMRYTLNPNELSLADSPCVKSAIFYDVLKIDGTTETRQHKSVQEGGEQILKNGIPIKKGMYGVKTLAGLLSDINYLQQDTEWEAEYEGDGSTLPVKLKAWLKEGGDILIAMVGEETAELVGVDPNIDPDNVVAAVAPTGDIAKAGKRNNKSDQAKIQTVHDHAVDLGAECKCQKCGSMTSKVELAATIQKTGGEEEMTEVEINKITGDVSTNIAKIMGETIAKTVGDALKPLEERLAKVEAQPLPPVTKSSVVISKQVDSGIVTDTDDVIAKVDDLMDEIQNAVPGLRAY